MIKICISVTSYAPDQGRPPPLRPWCISPCFRFTPLFSNNVQTLWKIFPILPFPEKFLDFHPKNFWWPFVFFSHQPQISNFPPVFAVSKHFPPISRKLFFPTLFKLPPVFAKFTCCLHSCTLYVFRFSSSLTMIHLCITQCTYWTPLRSRSLQWAAPVVSHGHDDNRLLTGSAHAPCTLTGSLKVVNELRKIVIKYKLD